MRKTLVTVDTLDGLICRFGNKIYIDSSMILSPGAKDELNKRGISVIYGPCPDQASCPEVGHGNNANPLAPCLSGNPDLEELLLGVTAILKKECGVTNPERLRSLSLQAMETIRDNL